MPRTIPTAELVHLFERALLNESSSSDDGPTPSNCSAHRPMVTSPRQAAYLQSALFGFSMGDVFANETRDGTTTHKSDVGAPKCDSSTLSVSASSATQPNCMDGEQTTTSGATLPGSCISPPPAYSAAETVAERANEVSCSSSNSSNGDGFPSLSPNYLGVGSLALARALSAVQPSSSDRRNPLGFSSQTSSNTQSAPASTSLQPGVVSSSSGGGTARRQNVWSSGDLSPTSGVLGSLSEVSIGFANMSSDMLPAARGEVGPRSCSRGGDSTGGGSVHVRFRPAPPPASALATDGMLGGTSTSFGNPRQNSWGVGGRGLSQLVGSPVTTPGRSESTVRSEFAIPARYSTAVELQEFEFVIDENEEHPSPPRYAGSFGGGSVRSHSRLSAALRDKTGAATMPKQRPDLVVPPNMYFGVEIETILLKSDQEMLLDNAGKAVMDIAPHLNAVFAPYLKPKLLPLTVTNTSSSKGASNTLPQQEGVLRGTLRPSPSRVIGELNCLSPLLTGCPDASHSTGALEVSSSFSANHTSTPSTPPLQSLVTNPAPAACVPQLFRFYEQATSRDDPYCTQWKLTTDLSIKSEDGNQVFALEFVSPKLKGVGGCAQVSLVCSELQHMGFSTNSSTALHVHVSCQHLSNEAVKRVCAYFVYFESVIDTWMPLPRRADYSKYCRSNLRSISASRDVDEALLKIAACDVSKSILPLIRVMCPRLSAVRNSHRNHKANLLPLLRTTQGSTSRRIEFRQHPGTCSPEEVTNWICFLTTFVDAASKLPLPQVPTSHQAATTFACPITGPPLPHSSQVPPRLPVVYSTSSPGRTQGPRPDAPQSALLAIPATFDSLFDNVLQSASLKAFYREQEKRQPGGVVFSFDSRELYTYDDEELQPSEMDSDTENPSHIVNARGGVPSRSCSISRHVATVGFEDDLSEGLGSEGLGSEGLGSEGLGSEGLGSEGLGSEGCEENDFTKMGLRAPLLASVGRPLPAPPVSIGGSSPRYRRTLFVEGSVGTVLSVSSGDIHRDVRSPTGTPAIVTEPLDGLPTPEGSEVSSRTEAPTLNGSCSSTKSSGLGASHVSNDVEVTHPTSSSQSLDILFVTGKLSSRIFPRDDEYHGRGSWADFAIAALEATLGALLGGILLYEGRVLARQGDEGTSSSWQRLQSWKAPSPSLRTNRSLVYGLKKVSELAALAARDVVGAAVECATGKEFEEVAAREGRAVSNVTLELCSGGAPSPVAQLSFIFGCRMNLVVSSEEATAALVKDVVMPQSVSTQRSDSPDEIAHQPHQGLLECLTVVVILATPVLSGSCQPKALKLIIDEKKGNGSAKKNSPEKHAFLLRFFQEIVEMGSQELVSRAVREQLGDSLALPVCLS